MGTQAPRPLPDFVRKRCRPRAPRPGRRNHVGYSFRTPVPCSLYTQATDSDCTSRAPPVGGRGSYLRPWPVVAKIAETTMTQPTNSRLAWFNGKFMPENQVLISFRDRSWKYGDGAFDMTRTFNGRAFRLKEHIDRFYRSLRYLRLDPGMSPQEMIDVSEQIVARNEHLRSSSWRLVDRPARQSRRRSDR